MRYPQGGGLTPERRAFRERIRIRAAELFALGHDNVTVAKQLRVSVRSVQRWHQAWEHDGASALESKGPASRPKLSEALFKVLEQELAKGVLAENVILPVRRPAPDPTLASRGRSSRRSRVAGGPRVMMTDRAATTGLPRCDECVRGAASAADERPGQRCRDPRPAPSDRGPGTPTRQEKDPVQLKRPGVPGGAAAPASATHPAACAAARAS
ncbi:helix-turn-helix domain-containing protein [Streptomyces sp. Mo3]|uniref:helix-turn-helix domain-containing protein n=1 Tax=Streptomyces sp. Mo3 TaxID=3161190 RepID=UPI0039F0A1F5